MPSQQNLRNRSLSIIIISAATNRLRDLVPLVPALKSALTSIQPCEVVKIGA